MKAAVISVLVIELLMIGWVIFFDREKASVLVMDDGTEISLEGRTRIIFWHGMGGKLGKIMKKMVTEFNLLPGNKYVIDAQYMGHYESLRQKLIASLISGTTPHCSQVYESWMAKMIKGDSILPLDNLIVEEDKEFLEDLVPVMRRNITFKDKIWSMPFNKSMPVLYYNKDMFRKVGLDPEHPPETWDEFLDYCRKLTRDTDGDGINDTWGFTFAANPWMFECLIFQAGGTMLSEDGNRVLLDSPAGLDSLRFMMDLVYKHKVAYVSMGYEGQKDYVAQAVGIVQGSSVSKVYLEEDISFDWGMAPLPGRDRKAAVLSGTNVALFAGKDPHETRGAWKFVKWFTDTERTAFWSEHTTYMPVRLSGLEILEDYLAQPLSSKAAIDQLPYSEFEPRISAWFKCRDILGEALADAMYLEKEWMEAGNEARPERYLVPMVEEMNTILYYEK